MATVDASPGVRTVLKNPLRPSRPRSGSKTIHVRTMPRGSALVRPGGPQPATVFVASRRDDGAAATPTAPPDAGSQLSYGLRVDGAGRVVPHSLLGSLEDFETLGDVPAEMSRQATMVPPSQPRPDHNPPVRYREILDGIPRWTKTAQQYENGREARHLKRWEGWNGEQKRQEQHIMSRMPPGKETLLMTNSVEAHRRVVEEQEMLETVLSNKRALPFDEIGHGYRVGSEYFAQPEVTKTGLQTTLKRSQKGPADGFLYIGKPTVVAEEQQLGSQLDMTRTGVERRSTFFANPYLTARQQAVQSGQALLFPHTPKMDQLQVVGRPYPSTNSSGDDGAAVADSVHANAPREEEVHTSSEAAEAADADAALDGPKPGPHLDCAGSYPAEAQPTTGDGTRILFTAHVGEKTESSFSLANSGTTALYYHWEKVETPNSLGTSRTHKQRFFFDLRPQAILPGETRTIPMYFLSGKSGIYIESWHLRVTPQLQYTPTVILSGTALQEDVHRPACEALEAETEKSLIEGSIRSLLLNLVDRVHTTKVVRPTPLVRTFDIFQQANAAQIAAQELDFDDTVVGQMARLHTQVCNQLWAEEAAPGKDEPAVPVPVDPKAKKGAPPVAAEEAQALDVPAVEPWDLSIAGLKRLMQTLGEVLPSPVVGQTWRPPHAYLDELNGLVTKLSAARDPAAAAMPRETIASAVIARMIDAVAAGCAMGRSLRKLPEMPLVVAAPVPEEVYQPRNISAPQKGAKKAPAKGGKDDGKGKKGGKGGGAEPPAALEPLSAEDAAALAPLQFALARQAVVAALDELEPAMAASK